MAAPDRRSSLGIDRRTSVSFSIAHPTDDDIDLETVGVADGFRPADVAATHGRIPSVSSQPHDLPQGRRTPPPRPSSTAKPRYGSFALRHDGAMGPVASSRHPTAAPASNVVPTRASSVSTDNAFIRAESPYQGPSGPSHPYNMYPQGAHLARTASVATSSTMQAPERSYAGPSGPTHPYGMYPQNTVPEVDPAAGEGQAAPVIAGFPGLNNDYRRRLGPDGEEVADIIGPDGHTEQLPPYSKYPDEALARKDRPAVIEPIPGAGGMGLATSNPEFASREDLTSPPSRRSTRSEISSDSNHQINTAALGASEKPKLKKWKRIARKKICGIIPVWAIALAGATLVIFAIILAGVLISLWRKHQENKHHSNDSTPPPGTATSATTMTTTYDASPFSSLPTAIPTLPTGTYQLPISTPSAAPNTCLDAPQSAAWSCSISTIIPYEMIINAITGANVLADNEINLYLENSSLADLIYGAQPPVLKHPQIMDMALDNYDVQRGPAWFFQTLYDKLVIVQESALVAPSNNKRQSSSPVGQPTQFVRKGVANAGDKPWFCYWNNTLVEAFIYVNQTSAAGARAAASSSATPPSSAHSSSTSPSASPSSAWGMPAPPFIPYYPKVVKVEERRVTVGADPIQPYCVQHFITGDGTAQPYLGSNGQPVTIYLNETESAVSTAVLRRHTVSDGFVEPLEELTERQSSSACGCVWLAQ